MSLPEAEKRREARRSADRDDGDDGREATGTSTPALGVSLVAALALLGGAVDLLAGVALLATPLFVIGIPLAAFGAVKCWVAVGLYRRRARALGLAVLLYGVGALVSAGRVVFAVGGGGDLAGPTGRLLLAIVVVGYLLVAADRFE